MSLEEILKHIQQAEQELAPLVEKENRSDVGRPVMYVFVYEKHFTDEDEWGPGSQYIEAYDLPSAFQSFGHVLEQMHLQVRNIRYGFYDEMQEEEDRIRAYWKQEHEKRRSRHRGE